METILYTTSTLYTLLVFAAIWGLLKLRQNDMGSKSKTEDSRNFSIAVVLPYRNEAYNLPNVLHDLENQSFKGPLEIIAVNDHSSDSSVEVCKNHSTRFSSFRMIDARGEGKKEALAEGIRSAGSDYVITIDADVRLNPTWLDSIANELVFTQADMLILPLAVQPNEHGGFLSSFQVSENLAIQAIGFGMAAFGLPVTCNGANLVFKKSVFMEVGGYGSHSAYASGDDVFLLSQFLKWHKKVIPALSDPLIATVQATPVFSQFISQRLRWAGKGRNMFYPGSLLVGSILVAHNAALLILPLATSIDIQVWAMALALKAILDVLLIKTVERRYSLRLNPLKLGLFAIAYIPYLPIVGFISNFWKPSWKGRKI